MEDCLLVSTIGDLKHFNDSYSRIYFGNEFCQNLIPTKNELSKAIKFAEEKGISFTFVTPLVTDSGLEKLSSLFKDIRKSLGRCEIVFNDLGVLRRLKREFPEMVPVFGRLNIRQKNGDVIHENALKKNILSILRSLVGRKRLTEGMNLDSPGMGKFLETNEINRVELNVPRSYKDIKEKKGISLSIYTPYISLSTTRICPIINSKNKLKGASIVEYCQKECLGSEAILTSKETDTPIFLRGNAYFVKNKSVKLPLPSVDRLIHQLD
jgi:hypothetical protein